MPFFSVYRGQSRTGIGEGPDRPPVPHGEQYLDADPPLRNDAAALSAIRPWMTLDWRPSDQQALGERIEAWSCFGHGELRYVVRLTAAGVYDHRAAYFAHARAWSCAEMRGGFDPGAHLGRSEAFDPPWRDGERREGPAPPAPEIVRPEQVAAEKPVAMALLSHLYQGLVEGYPVVMAVPVADFVSGAPLHALISFARAALPLALKRDCRIRVYTRLPELFLRHLGAHLIVIPENEAASALAVRRDAALLDRQGARREGPEPCREVQAYADAVVKRACALPATLLAFSGVVGEHLNVRSIPLEQELPRIPILYNLLAAQTDPKLLGSLLRDFLLKKLNEQPAGLSWERLIRAEDWEALSFADLVEVILQDARTDEARALRQRAEAEARRPARTEIISTDRLERWWNEFPAERRLARLAELLDTPPGGRALIDREAAAHLTAQVPLRQIRQIDVPGHLLRAEEEAGLLGNREHEAEELAEIARRDPIALQTLVRASSRGSLDEDWQTRLLANADERIVVYLAQERLPIAFGPEAWRNGIEDLFTQLFGLSRIPVELHSLLLQASTKVDPVRDFRDHLHLTEALVRAGLPEGRKAVERLWREIGKIERKQDRLYFASRLADPEWMSLDPGRLLSWDGRIEPAWVSELGDRLLASDKVRKVLPVDQILRMAPANSPLGPWLDSKMESQPEQTTSALLLAGRWSTWRTSSKLDATGLRSAALAWLASDVWKGSAAPQARLEDWKQVMEDLAPELSGDELSSLGSGRPPRAKWPWITLFQDVQLTDLCSQTDGDPGVLATLAEMIDPQRDLKYPIQGTIFDQVLAQAGLARDLPGEALQHLTAARDLSVLPLRQAEVLLERTRYRSDRAVAALRRSIEDSLAKAPLDALRAAGKLGPWSHEAGLLKAVEHWLDKQKSVGDVSSEIWRILEERLPRRGSAGGGPRAKRLATQLREAGYPKLADYLHPASKDSRDDKPRKPLAALEALARLEAEHPCWNELIASLRKYYSRGELHGHPVSRLADEIRQARPHLESPICAALESKGWDTFVAVARAHPLVLCEPRDSRTPLPALELATLLLPDLGLGRIALRLAFHESTIFHADKESWWESLFAGIAAYAQPDGSRRFGDREELALALIHQKVHQMPHPSVARSALAKRMREICRDHGAAVAIHSSESKPMTAGAAK